MSASTTAAEQQQQQQLEQLPPHEAIAVLLRLRDRIASQVAQAHDDLDEFEGLMEAAFRSAGAGRHMDAANALYVGDTEEAIEHLDELVARIAPSHAGPANDRLDKLFARIARLEETVVQALDEGKRTSNA